MWVQRNRTQPQVNRKAHSVKPPKTTSTGADFFRTCSPTAHAMIRPGESQMQIVRHSLRFVLSCVVLVTSANVAAAQAPSGARLLVLLRNASALAIVDPASGKVLGRVPVGRDPHEVAVTPDGSMAFVASPSEGISVIDVRAMKEIRRIDTGTASAP